LWDNYPVNDGPMERALHLGPYRGRSAALSDALAGVLCNPMVQPWASRVALATAADYLRDPASYDPEAAWALAIADVAGPRAAALDALARACADGPLQPPEQLEASRLAAGVVNADDPVARIASARDHFVAVKTASRAWSDAPEDALGAELEPWLDQARREAAAALAALELLEQVEPVDGSARGVDAERALVLAFGVLFAWDAARAGDRTVFGPRFAIYPAIVQLADGQAGLDVDLAITEDRNAVDRLCRHALDVYREWTRTLR
jgi:hypothetical protein